MTVGTGWRGVIVRSVVAVTVTAPAVLALAAASLGPAPASAEGPGARAGAFESHWQDGKAELSGYRYSVTRYGQRREGTAVLIYVTEPFSESRRVKVDNPKKNPKDTFEALKLNLVREFTTGIYNYHTLSSVFMRSRDLTPSKITFSSAEWCGHVFEEMTFEKHHIADRYLSYFEGESDLKRLTLRENAVTEEELFVRLRGLRGEWLRPGERRTVPFLPSAFHRRLRHRPFVWSEARIERARGVETVRVPAGRFEASIVTVRTEHRVGRFWIETAYPHRIVRWVWAAAGSPPPGRGSPAEALDQGELTGSTRLAYWKLNATGHERYRRELGLAPAPASPQRGRN